ncbi:unnamed protein product [Brassica rapa]|uniref:Uncharacterized protein n=2 Tax=Brassica TaxID=3705 RepID=A0A8D9HUQ3_BRACM|nr:unnamed protein product [Brassica napus]CAG7905810.1 unnamed protein product [Brassica rapa]
MAPIEQHSLFRRNLRRCPSAKARLATDGKLCAYEIYGVADNINGTDVRFVNSSFNRPNLFGLLGGYILFPRMSPVTHIFIAVNVLELIREDRFIFEFKGLRFEFSDSSLGFQCLGVGIVISHSSLALATCMKKD